MSLYKLRNKRSQNASMSSIEKITERNLLRISYCGRTIQLKTKWMVTWQHKTFLLADFMCLRGHSLCSTYSPFSIVLIIII